MTDNNIFAPRCSVTILSIKHTYNDYAAQLYAAIPDKKGNLRWRCVDDCWNNLKQSQARSSDLSFREHVEAAANRAGYHFDPYLTRYKNRMVADCLIKELQSKISWYRTSYPAIHKGKQFVKANLGPV